MIQVGENGIVRFIFDRKSSKQVYLVGDFNNWDEHSHPMKLVDGNWMIEIQLAPGEYEFKYLVDKIWFNDYAAHKYNLNAWGSDNSVVIVNKSPIYNPITTNNNIELPSTRQFKARDNIS